MSTLFESWLQWCWIRWRAGFAYICKQPVVYTTLGYMDEAVLQKKTGCDDNEERTLFWTEFRYKDEIVHRSVHIEIKKGIELNCITQD